MTSADTAQHPDVSEISELIEGLLAPSREGAVRRHIATCEECGEVHTSLEEIRSLLGDTASHEPMPVDVADRIDAALAAEAAATGVTSTPSVSRETYRSQEASSTDRPGGRPRGATGPGRIPAGRRRRRTVILGTAFGAAAVGMSVLLLQPFQPSQSSSSSAADQGVSTDKRSASDYADGSLEGRVHSLLGGKEASEPAGHDTRTPSLKTKSSPDLASPENASPPAPLNVPAVDVPPCVQKGTGRNAPALALEQGRFNGKAAFLVILPHTTDSARVEAYVVDAACVSSATAKGRLLLTHSYTRP